MKVMETFLYQLSWDWPALSVLLSFVALLAVLTRIQKWRVVEQRNALLSWFSSLHTFSKNVDESSDTKEVTEAALAGTLRTFGEKDGLMILGGDAAACLSHICVYGLSPRTTEVVAAEPLRSYLASAAERWGPLLVVPDLHLAGALEEWQRVPHLREFVTILRGEGLKSLLIIGLATRGQTCGVLVVGRRKPGNFVSAELQLAMAIGNQLSVALDHRWLVREGERRDAELRALDQAGRAMRVTVNLDEQMAALRQSMKWLFEGCEFALAMQESPEQPLEVVVPFERCKREGREVVREVSPLETEVAQTNTPCLIVDDCQLAKYSPGDAEAVAGVRTWCGVPMRFTDGSLGVLEVANFEREHAITAQQCEIIRVLANEAAGAFENARAFRREQRRASYLALLNEISRKASSVLDPKEMLSGICMQARKAFGYNLVLVEVWDRGKDELVVEAQSGFGEEVMGRRTSSRRDISGEAMERREPLVKSWEIGEAVDAPLPQEVRCSVSLPLDHQDELLGVLTLASRRPQAFPAPEVLALKTLADQVAIALHNAREYQTALEGAITDGLTGLKTHRYFMETLEREVSRSHRSGLPFAVIMTDLDQFKTVNDQHGHAQGDRVLRRVAKLIEEQIRQSWVAARYGGDEFSILLPETTVDQARYAAERLRESIEKEPLLASHHLTASFGIAAFPEHGTTQEILHVADSGMYLAKHRNGNRVSAATPGQDSKQVQAYFDVEFRRKFSSDPGAFNQALNSLEKAKS